jgi:hypothetical protein
MLIYTRTFKEDIGYIRRFSGYYRQCPGLKSLVYRL